MVSELIIIIIILWLPQALYQLLNLSYWLQVKEYRFDRIKAFLASSDGRSKTQLYLIATKLILSFASIFSVFAFVAALVLFFLSDVAILEKISSRKVRRPVFTQRGKRIFATGIISILAGMFLLLYIKPVNATFFIIEVLLFVSPFAGILWTIPIVNKIKRKEIKEAKIKLKKINPLVIGITGSYGKSTTKEFIYHLLSKKYKCEKTTKNENTDFGIARKILNDFKNDTQIFIVEMGAYKKGEIKNLAGIVEPTLGVITGIEPQHVELFGSLENIKKAKYELIEALPPEGIALFNASSENIDQLISKARKQKLKKVATYQLLRSGRKKGGRADMTATVLDAKHDGIKLSVDEGKVSKIITVPLAGVHLLENLTGAILIARLLNVPWRDIINACKSVELPDRTMKTSKLAYGSLFIDDSYNSTPASFRSALEYLSQFKANNKVLLTPGIIELGSMSAKIHKDLGRRMVGIADKIIVTNSEAAKMFMLGTVETHKFQVIDDPQKLIVSLESEVEKGSIILVEGRVPDNVHEFLKRRVK